MKKLDTREAKINFLKSLALGKASIEDLAEVKPPVIEVWRMQSDFETYKSSTSGEVLTRGAIGNKYGKRKNYLAIIVERGQRYGNLPVFNSEEEAQKYWHIGATAGRFPEDQSVAE